ncbi:MAG: putative porin [Bacteroidia bacterium]
MKRFSLLFYFLFLFSSVCISQNKDTIPVLENDTMRVSIFRGIEKFYLYRYDSVNMVRTMDSLVIYNPVIKKHNLNTSLGNIGASVFAPFYNPTVELGFIAGIDSRRLFIWESSDLRFVNSHKRYSRVNYVNGSKKENYIEVEHSQSFGKNLDIGFRYGRINSLGYYSGQQTFLSKLNFYGRLSSRNQRYLVLFNVALNSNKNQENGSITADSLFEDDLVSNVKFLPVNLSDAQSQVKDNSFMVHQHYDLGKRVHSPQSIDDSLKMDSSTIFIPRFRIGHEISFRKNFFLYTDGLSASGFYADTILDPASTRDSIGVKNLENTVSFSFFGGQDYKNYLSFSVRHQLTQVNYGANIPDTADGSVFVQTDWFNNNNVFVQGNAGISNKIFNKIWVDAAYCVVGYNLNDFSLSGGFKTTYFEANASLTAKEPDYFAQRYVSNHFQWTNNFGKVFNAGAEGAFILQKWKLRAGAAYNLVNNLVYFGQDAKPAQYGGSITILKAFVQKRFTVGKFSLDNDVTYQYVKDYMPVRLPAVVLRSSFFFEDKLFKKALHSRFGVDVYYNTAWHAYNYMPATGQFYLQDSKRYGNYPYIDVYAAFRVKGARFFFKLDHAFAGLLGNTYYGAAHYPLNGRTFKFGVDWTFLD